MALDFIVRLLELQRSDEGKSYNLILVIVNRFSKMTQYIPVCNTIDAAKLANMQVHKLILQGAGVPSSIVNKLSPQFTSKFWSMLCYYLNIKQQLSTAYHLQ
jgi:hypothetical protein